MIGVGVKHGAMIGVITALMAAGPGVSGLQGQESEAAWTPRERARIGVLLAEKCAIHEVETGSCDEAPVVTSVVVNGPADRAGLLARDTLLAVDGTDVRTARGREALLALEAGIPVVLDVGRASGRAAIEVTPEIRSAEPYVDVRTMFFGSEPEVLDGAKGEVRVVRIPSVRGRLDEVKVRLDSLRTRGNEFVFFHEDAEGTLKVDVGDPETVHIMLERIREFDRRVEEVPSAGRNEDGIRSDSPSPNRIDVELRTNFPGYVWENEELARKLTRVRDSSLRTARVHLDSLVRLYGRVRTVTADSLDLAVRTTTDADPQGAWAYYVAPRPIPEQLRELLSSHRRLAGAEFRELGPDLAEYFAGVDEGLLVLRVIGDTPASRMGLREGDVVIEVSGVPVSDMTTLRRTIASSEAHAIRVKWIRKGTVHVGRMNSH